MTVSYKGLTGELIKLETSVHMLGMEDPYYTLSIYDLEIGVLYNFTCVHIKDVKFSNVDENQTNKHSEIAVPYFGISS